MSPSPRVLYLTPIPIPRYVFPGIGLGANVVRAKRISDKMFYAAARVLADMVTEEQLAAGRVLPPLSDIRLVSARVAAAVAASAVSEGLVQRMPPPGDLVEYMMKAQYVPEYAPLINDTY